MNMNSAIFFFHSSQRCVVLSSKLHEIIYIVPSIASPDEFKAYFACFKYLSCANHLYPLDRFLVFIPWLMYLCF